MQTRSLKNGQCRLSADFIQWKLQLKCLGVVVHEHKVKTTSEKYGNAAEHASYGLHGRNYC